MKPTRSRTIIVLRSSSNNEEDKVDLTEPIPLGWKEYLMLEAMMISPTGIYLLTEEFHSKQLLISIILYITLTLFLLPYLLMMYLKTPLIRYLFDELEHISRQTKAGFIYLFAFFVSVLLAYYFASKIFFASMLTLQNVKQDIGVLTALVLYSFVAPILDEWFWRIFLKKLLYPRGGMVRSVYVALHSAIIYALLFFNLSESYVKSTYIGIFFLSMFLLLQCINEYHGIVSSFLAQLGLHVALSIIAVDILVNKK